jgi:hypothetical protein
MKMKKGWICLAGIVLGILLVIPALAAEEQKPGMMDKDMGTGKREMMPMHRVMCPCHSMMKGMCGMMKDMAGMMEQTDAAKQNPEMMKKCKQTQQRCDETMKQMDQMMTKCKEMMHKGLCPMAKRGRGMEEGRQSGIAGKPKHPEWPPSCNLSGN